MNQHLLTGLDAQNPLAYLAALGLLRILSNYEPEVALSFSHDGLALPTLHSALPWETILEVVLTDAVEQGHDRALGLAYDKEGNLVAPGSPQAIRDLKPLPPSARQFLGECAAASRRSADLALAFFSELVQDNNGNSKPTAFHFTAGQQTFLGFVELLRQGISASDLEEALLGPWLNTSQLPSLNWDATSSRNYALRARNPSLEKRGSIAGANWLGVHALAYFPAVADASKLATRSSEKLVTAGIRGGWKTSTFTWPIWAVPARSRTVASLLRVHPRRWSATERAAMGICQVFFSKIARSDQGGYGSFSPAAVYSPPPPKSRGARGKARK